MGPPTQGTADGTAAEPPGGWAVSGGAPTGLRAGAPLTVRAAGPPGRFRAGERGADAGAAGGDQGAGLPRPAPEGALRSLPRALADTRPRLRLRGRADRDDAVRVGLLPRALDQLRQG